MFKFPTPPGTQKKAGTTATKPAPKATTKKVATSTGTRSGGVGYRKYQGDALWLPNTTRPEWLDGSLPGDRGFDPLGKQPGLFAELKLWIWGITGA